MLFYMYAFTCVSILSDFMSGIMHYDHLHMYLFYFIIIGGFNKDYYYYYYYRSPEADLMDTVAG